MQRPGAARVIDTARAGTTYARTQRARRERLERDFRRAGVDSIFVETGKPYTPSFLRFFRERAKRMH
jgi:uncharacterized protein (DUF58 family)